MYCPRCARQNVDEAKFCRHCGTDLETIALALEGKLVPPIQVSDDKSRGWDAPNKGWEDKYNNPQTTEDWLRKHSAGVNFMARGATVLGAALLALVVILTLFGVSVWPLIIWAIIFGWMSWWGVASVAEGLGAIMQSRNMLARREPMRVDSDTDSQVRLLSDTGGLPKFPDATLASEARPQMSVTEDTTARLNKQHPQF